MEPLTLISNGLSIVGTVISAGSFIRGFSLEKRMQQIEVSMNKLEQLNYLLKNEFDLQNAVLQQINAEHKNIRDSTLYTEKFLKNDVSGLLKKLIKDPYDAGVTNYSDIPVSGIGGLERVKIIKNHMAPITWNNYITNNSYIGEIPLSMLEERYGINISIPNYKYSVNGHVYCDNRGLYVPQHIVQEK